MSEIEGEHITSLKISRDDELEGPSETNVDELESDNEDDQIDSFEDTDDEEIMSEQFIEESVRPVSLISRSSQNSK